MNYYLSSSDVSVLNKTINTVNNLTGATPKNQKPVIKNAFAYVELTTQDVNGLWSAKEVYFDETGTPNELIDGRTWGGDNPSIIINGEVEEEQVVRIEAHYLVDPSNEEQAVWVGSAIGGGGELFRLRCNLDTTIGRDTINLNFDLVDELNTIITPNVAVTQSRFNSAFFYVDEVIYAIDSDVATYSVDPFIFGVGG